MPELIATGALVILVLVLVAMSVRVIQQSYVGIVQRMGRYQRTIGPGVHLLVPMLDRVATVVDMKETVQAFAPQPVITEDNVTIGIDTVVYYQVTDSVKATYEVANVLHAMEQLTITTLGTWWAILEETLTSRDSINSSFDPCSTRQPRSGGARDRSSSSRSTRRGRFRRPWSSRCGRPRQRAAVPDRGREAGGHPSRRGMRQAAILNAEADQQANVLGRRARSRRAPSGPRARPRRSTRSSAPLPTRASIPARCSATSTSRRCRVAAGDANKLLLLPAGAAQAMGAAVGLGAAFAEGAAPTPPGGSKEPKTGQPDDRGDSQ
jgi:hypothetical protein